MKKLLPILLAIIGIGAGIGAGMALRPASVDLAETIGPCGDIEMQKHADETPEEEPVDEAVEYVKLNNQFVIPVVDDNRVGSLVVVSLSVEVDQGRKDEVYTREPKLRDAFLQVFFDHANNGGFRGAFTNANNMNVLRKALRETGKDVVGDLISDVLIMDITRQDV